MDNRLIAYLLILLMMLALAALIGWRAYNSRDRVILRQRRREKEHRERRLEASVDET